MSEAVMRGGEGATERRGIIGGGTPYALLGAAAVVLGIVGLASRPAGGTVALYLDAIAGLVLGLALIVAGIALSLSYARLLARAENTAETGGYLAGTTVDMFLGGAALILGVLAILHVLPAALISVEVIVLGVALMLNGVATVRLVGLETSVLGQPSSVGRRVTEELALATASVRVVAGVATLVLGILGVIGTAPVELTLVAMVVAGAALLLNSNAIGSRVARAVRN